MEKPKTERPPQAPEADYRMLMEQASDGIFLADASGHFIEVNTRACAMTGYSREELLTLHLSGLLEPEELKGRPIQLESLEEDSPFFIERTFRRKDGSLFQGEISAKRFSDGRVQGIVRDITERKALEDDLLANQQLLQTVFDTIPIPLYVKDMQGRYTHVNQALGDSFDRDPESFIGKRVEDLPGYTPELAAYLSEKDMRVLENGEAIDIPEFTVVNPSGQSLIRHSRRVPLRGPKGEIIGLIGISEDITEKKHAEEALIASEMKFQRLVEGRAMGTMISVDHKIVFCNRAVLDLLGLETSKKLMGKDILQTGFIHQDYSKSLAEIREKIIEGQKAPAEFYTRAIKADGSNVWLEIFPQRIEWEGHEALLTSWFDITAAKLAEEERNRLAEAVDQAGDLVMITDIEGVIEYVNPAFERVTGYSREEVLGKKPSILKSGIQDVVFYQAMWDTLLSGKSWVGDYINRRKDGSNFHVDAVHSPIKNDRGEITHFIAVHHDITGKAELEEQLRQSQKMEAVGQLAGGIAHEFNNLLQIIKGYSELALRKTPPGDPNFKDLQQILSASEKAGRLTSHLLAFTRQQALEKQPMNLNDLVETLREVIGPLTGVDIEIELIQERNLPRIMGDWGMIEQVMMNLLVNARDAMPNGGRLVIETRTAQPPEKFLQAKPEISGQPLVLLRVQDTGEGIHPDHIEKIFDPFFTTKDLGKGTGLGLAMAYGIIQQHNGTIEVRSEPGQGAEFFIYLPALIEKPETGLDREARGNPSTVLIAEDNEGIQEILARMLEQGGYNVLRASTGEEALSIFHRDPRSIDAAILDMRMPKGGGIVVYQGMRKMSRTLPIFFASGLNFHLSEFGIEDDPNVKIFLKPYRYAEIIGAIENSLESGE